MVDDRQIAVYEVRVSKSHLMRVSRTERLFFLLLGQLGNEVMILHKAMMGTETARPKDGSPACEFHAYVCQEFFFKRLLMAKLFEGWIRIFKPLFYSTPLKRKYDPHLKEDTHKALKELDAFFGKNKYPSAIRNCFGFHYDSKKLDEAISFVPKHETWSIFLSQMNGNSLYYLPDMIVGHGVLREIDKDNAEAAYLRLHKDAPRIAGLMMRVATDCMSAVAHRRFRSRRLKLKKPAMIRAARFSDIHLPFFATQ